MGDREIAGVALNELVNIKLILDKEKDVIKQELLLRIYENDFIHIVVVNSGSLLTNQIR